MADQNANNTDQNTDQTPGGGNQTDQTPGGGGASESPFAALPEDIRSNEAFTDVKDVESLARGYLDVKKQLAELPGAPEKPEDYQIAAPDGMRTDDGMMEAFKLAAHKAGLSPDQARFMADWNFGLTQKRMETIEAQRVEGEAALKKEWGADYKKNLDRAKAAFSRLFGKEGDDFLDRTGLGNDPAAIKALYGASTKLSEDFFETGGASPGSGDPGSIAQRLYGGK